MKGAAVAREPHQRISKRRNESVHRKRYIVVGAAIPTGRSRNDRRGRPFTGAYAEAYVAGGRVFVPVYPLLTRLADRIYYEGSTLIVERGGSRIGVVVGPVPSGFNGVYVMAAPVLTRLDAQVRFDARHRILFVRTARNAVPAPPTPFNAAAPTLPPATVFTPEPVATPRPIWTGSPLPRRTPLPFFTPARKQYHLPVDAAHYRLVRRACFESGTADTMRGGAIVPEAKSGVSAS